MLVREGGVGEGGRFVTHHVTARLETLDRDTLAPHDEARIDGVTLELDDSATAQSLASTVAQLRRLRIQPVLAETP